MFKITGSVYGNVYDGLSDFNSILKDLLLLFPHNFILINEDISRRYERNKNLRLEINSIKEKNIKLYAELDRCLGCLNLSPDELVRIKAEMKRIIENAGDEFEPSMKELLNSAKVNMWGVKEKIKLTYTTDEDVFTRIAREIFYRNGNLSWLKNELYKYKPTILDLLYHGLKLVAYVAITLPLFIIGVTIAIIVTPIVIALSLVALPFVIAADLVSSILPSRTNDGADNKPTKSTEPNGDRHNSKSDDNGNYTEEPKSTLLHTRNHHSNKDTTDEKPITPPRTPSPPGIGG